MFPAVSIVFTLVVAALVASWGRPPPHAEIGRTAGTESSAAHRVWPDASLDTDVGREWRYVLFASIAAEQPLW